MNSKEAEHERGYLPDKVILDVVIQKDCEKAKDRHGEVHKIESITLGFGKDRKAGI